MSQDELNNIFKSKLSDTQSGDGYWNIPPDRIFDDAITQVNNVKQERRRRIFIILFMVFLGLIIGFGVLKTKRHIDNLNSQVANLEAQMASSNNQNKIEVKTDQTNSEFPKTSHLNNENQIEEGEATSDTSSELFNHIKKENQSHIPVINFNHQVIPNSLITIPDDVYDLEESENFSDNIETEPIERSIIILENYPRLAGLFSLIDFPDLSSHKIKELNFGLNPFVPYQEKQEELNVEHNDYFELGIFGVSNFSSLSMNNISGEETFILSYYDQLKRGKGIGVEFSYRINPKFAIIASLSFNQLRNISKLEDTHLYDKSSETINSSGVSFYNSQVDMMTPLGNYKSSMTFEVDSENIAHLDPITNITNLQQELSVVNSTIGIRYMPLVKQKIELFIGTGYSLSSMSSFNNSMETKFMKDELLIFSYDTNSADKKKLK